MNFAQKILPGILFCLATTMAAAAGHDWPQWRGPHRNGISDETGLLPQWPQEGPKLLWKITDAGSGYAAPAVAGDRFYLLFSEGLENESVAAFSIGDGKKLWSARLGRVGCPKQQPSFPTARSTPTVDGVLLYALGSDGDLACVETASGKIRWKKNLLADFGGKCGVWAYAESPLIDGDTLLCTPGGGEATLLALNKHTGEVLWKCPLPEADEAAYASAIVTEAGGVRQYAQLLQKGLVGVEPKTGKLLWRYAKPVSAFNANIPSPTASGDYIYAGSAGTGGGAVRLKAKEGGIAAEQAYFSAKNSTAIGGTIKLGDYLYGTTAQTLQCLEFTTGKLVWDDRGQGAGALCYADGRLYVHGENGDAALVEPTAEGYREKGRFSPPDQPKHSSPMEKAWAYPVVANGRFYLRDHGVVWCYDVKAR